MGIMCADDCLGGPGLCAPSQRRPQRSAPPEFEYFEIRGRSRWCTTTGLHCHPPVCDMSSSGCRAGRARATPRASRPRGARPRLPLRRGQRRSQPGKTCFGLRSSLEATRCLRRGPAVAQATRGSAAASCSRGPGGGEQPRLPAPGGIHARGHARRRARPRALRRAGRLQAAPSAAVAGAGVGQRARARGRVQLRTGGPLQRPRGMA